MTPEFRIPHLSFLDRQLRSSSPDPLTSSPVSTSTPLWKRTYLHSPDGDGTLIDHHHHHPHPNHPYQYPHHLHRHPQHLHQHPQHHQHPYQHHHFAPAQLFSDFSSPTRQVSSTATPNFSLVETYSSIQNSPRQNPWRIRVTVEAGGELDEELTSSPNPLQEQFEAISTPVEETEEIREMQTKSSAPLKSADNDDDSPSKYPPATPLRRSLRVRKPTLKALEGASITVTPASRKRTPRKCAVKVADSDNNNNNDVTPNKRGRKLRKIHWRTKKAMEAAAAATQEEQVETTGDAADLQLDVVTPQVESTAAQAEITAAQAENTAAQAENIGAQATKRRSARIRKRFGAKISSKIDNEVHTTQPDETSSISGAAMELGKEGDTADEYPDVVTDQTGSIGAQTTKRKSTRVRKIVDAKVRSEAGTSSGAAMELAASGDTAYEQPSSIAPQTEAIEAQNTKKTLNKAHKSASANAGSEVGSDIHATQSDDSFDTTMEFSDEEAPDAHGDDGASDAMQTITGQMITGQKVTEQMITEQMIIEQMIAEQMNTDATSAHLHHEQHLDNQIQIPEMDTILEDEGFSMVAAESLTSMSGLLSGQQCLGDSTAAIEEAGQHSDQLRSAQGAEHPEDPPSTSAAVDLENETRQQSTLAQLEMSDLDPSSSIMLPRESLTPEPSLSRTVSQPKMVMEASQEIVIANAGALENVTIHGQGVSRHESGDALKVLPRDLHVSTTGVDLASAVETEMVDAHMSQSVKISTPDGLQLRTDSQPIQYPKLPPGNSTSSEPLDRPANGDITMTDETSLGAPSLADGLSNGLTHAVSEGQVSGQDAAAATAAHASKSETESTLKNQQLEVSRERRIPEASDRSPFETGSKASKETKGPKGKKSKGSKTTSGAGVLKRGGLPPLRLSKKMLAILAEGPDDKDGPDHENLPAAADDHPQPNGKGDDHSLSRGDQATSLAAPMNKRKREDEEEDFEGGYISLDLVQAEENNPTATVSGKKRRRDDESLDPSSYSAKVEWTSAHYAELEKLYNLTEPSTRAPIYSPSKNWVAPRPYFTMPPKTLHGIPLPSDADTNAKKMTTQQQTYKLSKVRAGTQPPSIFSRFISTASRLLPFKSASSSSAPSMVDRGRMYLPSEATAISPILQALPEDVRALFGDCIYIGAMDRAMLLGEAELVTIHRFMASLRERRQREEEGIDEDSMIILGRVGSWSGRKGQMMQDDDATDGDKPTFKARTVAIRLLSLSLGLHRP